MGNFVTLLSLHFWANTVRHADGSHSVTSTHVYTTPTNHTTSRGWGVGINTYTLKRWKGEVKFNKEDVQAEEAE